MTEIWLRPNQRPVLFSMILPTIAVIVGVILVGFGIYTGRAWMDVVGGVIAVLSLVVLASLWRILKTPRLAYKDEQLLVYLGDTSPIGVPIEFVECFFPGQGPTGMKALSPKDDEELETANVIVRLAESAEEWKHRDVRAEFGHWCDSYIVIRGTWCERINGELLKKMNGKLAEIHRNRRKQAEAKGAT